MLYAVQFYSQYPEKQGAPSWPYQVVEISDDQKEQYETNNFSVFTYQDLEAYKVLNKPEYDAWVKINLKPASPIKIYRYAPNNFFSDKTTPPLGLDYVVGLSVKLHRRSIIVKGECKSEEFYVNFDGTTYSDMVLKEVHTFYRDGLGFALKRESIISWICEDNTTHAITKTLLKFYNQYETIEEGQTRRGNLINGLQRPIIGFICMYLGGMQFAPQAIGLARTFTARYKPEMQNFIDESNKGLITAIQNTDEPWIDFMTPYKFTIRQYLTSELTI